MSRGSLIGPMIVGVALVVAGFYLRTDGSSTASFLGGAFVVIGLLSLVVNAVLYARYASRRR